MASNANKGAHQIEKPNIVDSLKCRLSAELQKKKKAVQGHSVRKTNLGSSETRFQSGIAKMVHVGMFKMVEILVRDSPAALREKKELLCIIKKMGR